MWDTLTSTHLAGHIPQGVSAQWVPKTDSAGTCVLLGEWKLFSVGTRKFFPKLGMGISKLFCFALTLVYHFLLGR